MRTTFATTMAAGDPVDKRAGDYGMVKKLLTAKIGSGIIGARSASLVT